MSRFLWGNKQFTADPSKLGVGAEVSHLVGAAVTSIRRPPLDQAIVIEAEVGEWRVRVGLHKQRQFGSGDIDIVNNTITDVDHGYETGDGPLRLEDVTAAYVDGGETLTFADADPDTIVRSLGTPGSFIADGFTVGMTITVSGTASNDGTYTLATVAALILTLVGGDALAAEALAGAGVTITGSSLPVGLTVLTNYWTVKIDDDTLALAIKPGNANRIKQTGLNSTTQSDHIPVDITSVGGVGPISIGDDGASMVEVAVTGTTDNGLLLDAAAGRPGNRLVFTARVITVKGFSATDALAFWFV